MINFISADDAAVLYDIGAAQLLAIIDSGLAAPYDFTRAKLSKEDFERLIKTHIQEETATAERQHNRSIPRPRYGFYSGRALNEIDQAYSDLRDTCKSIRENARIDVLCNVCFLRDELEAALQELYPKFFKNYLASKRPHIDPEPMPATADAQEQIKKLEAILPSLSEARRMTAKLMIEKWKGQSHIEAYKAVYVGKVEDGSAKTTVSRKRHKAIELVSEFEGLIMPPWGPS